MASKRKLKKGFIALSTELFNEALLFRAFSKEDEATALDEIMDQLIVWTDDTIRRISHPDGKDNPKLVKAYYKKLHQDIETRATEIGDELTKCLERL